MATAAVLKTDEAKALGSSTLSLSAMNTQHTITHDSGDSLTIRDVQINGKNYHVQLVNRNGKLRILFNTNPHVPDFEIAVKDNVSISRYAYRPHHDHDDTQDLYIVKGDDPVRWYAAQPNSAIVGNEFKIPFGSTRLRY